MQLKKIVVLEGNDETAAAITNELNAAGFEVCASAMTALARKN